MRDVFEKVASAAEAVKEKISKGWENIKQKFEGTKSEMAQEVMDAKSPEDLIAAGKKLQEQGEALKAEEAGVKQEEVQGEVLNPEKTETEFVANDKQLR